MALYGICDSACLLQGCSDSNYAAKDRSLSKPKPCQTSSNSIKRVMQSQSPAVVIFVPFWI